MGCGSSTQVKQGAPAAAEVHPDEYERDAAYSSSGEEESSSGSYDSYESDAASEPDEMPEPEKEPEPEANEDEVRAQEAVKPLAVGLPLTDVASPTGSFMVRKTRQRRSSVELFKARDAEAKAGADASPRATADQVARLAEDGPDLDEGVAGLVDGWLQACVVGDAGKLWGLLAPQMQEQLTDEAAALSDQKTPQEHCVTKNGWHWPESRGKFLKMRVSSFDGHMCGIRSSFDTGLLTVDYRDVVWVRDGRITAAKSIQMLTHEVRRKLAADLVDHAASGREDKVWLALAPSMRARYEKSVEKRRLTAEEECLQEHSWLARRGEFEGQKLVTYDESTGTAVIHAYFRQGGIDQVAYKELFSVSSGMVTDRQTEFMVCFFAFPALFHCFSLFFALFFRSSGHGLAEEASGHKVGRKCTINLPLPVSCGPIKLRHVLQITKCMRQTHQQASAGATLFHESYGSILDRLVVVIGGDRRRGCGDGMERTITAAAGEVHGAGRKEEDWCADGRGVLHVCAPMAGEPRALHRD